MNIFQEIKLLLQIKDAVNTIEEGKMKSGYLSSSAVGSYTATLTVTDNQNLTGTATVPSAARGYRKEGEPMKILASMLILGVLGCSGCVCMSRHNYNTELQLAELRGSIKAHVYDLGIVSERELNSDEKVDLIGGKMTLDKMRITYEDASMRASNETNKRLSTELLDLMSPFYDFYIDAWMRVK
jgi:hypothetical protein